MSETSDVACSASSQVIDYYESETVGIQFSHVACWRRFPPNRDAGLYLTVWFSGGHAMNFYAPEAARADAFLDGWVMWKRSGGKRAAV
jgi:hypothetical protein